MQVASAIRRAGECQSADAASSVCDFISFSAFSVQRRCKKHALKSSLASFIADLMYCSLVGIRNNNYVTLYLRTRRQLRRAKQVLF